MRSLARRGSRASRFWAARAVADLHEHSQRGLGEGFLGGRRFMVGADASRHVGDSSRPFSPEHARPRRPRGEGGPDLFRETSGAPPRRRRREISITSASPRTRGRAAARGLLRPEDRTRVFPFGRRNARRGHEEEVEGSLPLAAISMSIRGRPRTLPISCESEMTAVVPIGTTSRASSAGVRRVLSRCMWLSISPGKTTWPAAADRPVRTPGSSTDTGDPAVGDDDVGRLDPPREDIDDLPSRNEQVARSSWPSATRTRRRSRAGSASAGRPWRVGPLARIGSIRAHDLKYSSHRQPRTAEKRPARGDRMR